MYGPLYRQIRPLWYHLNRRAPNTLMTREKALWNRAYCALFHYSTRWRKREKERDEERKIEKSSGGRRLDSVNRNREQLCPFVRSWPLRGTRPLYEESSLFYSIRDRDLNNIFLCPVLIPSRSTFSVSTFALPGCWSRSANNNEKYVTMRENSFAGLFWLEQVARNNWIEV